MSIRPLRAAVAAALLAAAALPAPAVAAPLQFDPFAPVSFTTGQSRFAVGDVNGDHHADLVTSGAQVIIRLGDGLGGFGPELTTTPSGTPFDVELADFDGDGDLDLATAHYMNDQVAIRMGNGDGTFQAAVTYAAGNDPFRLAAADFNGDGDIDLAFGMASGNQLGIFSNAGDGTLTPYGISLGTSSTNGLVAADFNGDAAPDIATSDSAADSSVVFINDGSGGFAAGVPNAVGDTPTDVVSADFDGDDNLDLATVNSGTNTVSVLSGDGTGNFAMQQTYTGVMGMIGLAAADFNGDGLADLGASNSNAAAVLVFESTGPGFDSAQSFPVDSGPQQLVAADLDGDDASDLASTSMSAKTVSVVRNANGPVIDTDATRDFGSLELGAATATRTVQVTNSGGFPLRLTASAVSGTAAADFTFGADTCSGTTVNAGQTCAVELQFKPAAKGARDATLELRRPNGASPHTVALQGTGTQTASPEPPSPTPPPTPEGPVSPPPAPPAGPAALRLADLARSSYCSRGDVSLRYSLNEAANVTFTVQKRRSPKLATPSSCPQRPSRGGRRTQIKYTTLKRTTVAVKAGANRVQLSKLVRKLAPGRYRVLITARAADGRVTGEQSIKVLVAKRRAG